MTVSVNETGTTETEMPDPAPDPGSLLASAEENAVQKRRIHTAIRSLPQGERIAVLLYYWGGGSCHDLALFLGISTTALKSRLHSGRRRLKERIPAVEPTNDENLPLLSGNPETLTETERTEMLREIEACYKRFTDAFEIQDPAVVMPLFTEDYELIFPQWMNEPAWNKARVEQDVLRCGIRPAGQYCLRAIIDGVLAVERNPATGTIREATARATFIAEWANNKPPLVRIDTFTHIGGEWKFRRTLSLGEEK